jgi:putative DNA primase/helicase
MNAARLLQSAHGNWAAILLAAGVPDRFLTGKHGPCPFCGGKDRYRFTDYQQRGGFICSRCNPDGGDGLALLIFGGAA